VVAPDAESDGGSIATTPPITGQVAPAAPGAPKKDLKRHAEENFEDEKDNLTEDGSLTGSPVKKQQVNMKKKKRLIWFLNSIYCRVKKKKYRRLYNCIHL
jgi:hypothetical protein